MNKITLLLATVFVVSLAHAVEMGVPIQLKLKDPNGVYPDDNNATFNVQILTPSNGCVLREENFTGQNVVSGAISLALGSGSRAGYDPNIPLTAVYDNSSVKNNLNCVDANNTLIGSGQSYNPAAADTRILRVRATITGVPIVAEFSQRSAPYAIHAESVGGKVASDILVQNPATSLNQSNLETLLLNATRFNKLQNLAVNGIADSATTATTAVTATNFSGSLAGDVTGNQAATVVAAIRGVGVAVTAPTSGQVLGYNGSQYVPMTMVASAPVTSVNGKIGAVVLTVSDISGALTSASAFAGDVTGNSSAMVVSSVGGKTAASVASAVNVVNAASALASANSLALRDGSGNLLAAGLTAAGASLQNIYLYEGTNTNYIQMRTPNSFANYTLVLPATDGNNGEVLQTDGNGNLSWSGGAAVTSAAINSALGYAPADNGAVVKRGNNLSDLVSATVARTNLGLGGAATMNVGTTAGTLAAGNDSRIAGALQQTSFNAYVAGATCTTGQSMYWNSVSSLFACQSISVGGDISGITSSATVVKIQGVGVSFSALASNHMLQYNGTNFVNRAIPTCGANQYLTFNGSAWSCAADIGGSGGVSAIAVTSPLQSTGGVTPILSMPQATASVSGYLIGTDWVTFNNKMAATSAAVISVLGYTPANSATVSLKANNLSDLTNAATARTNLGLGTFATANTLDLGSASATGTLAIARLPAMTGDVTSTAGSNSLTVEKIRNVTVNAAAPNVGDALVYNGSEWIPAPVPRSSKMGANVSLSGTTYSDIMSFAVTSGKTYKFKFNILYATSGTTRGLRLRINHGGATTYSVLYSVPGSTTVGTGYIAAASFDASGDQFTSSSATPSGVQIAQAEGIIVASADGTVQLAASQSGSGTGTVYAGSVVEFREIP